MARDTRTEPAGLTLDVAAGAAARPARRVLPWTIDDAWVAVAAALPFVATALGRTPADDLAYLVRAGDVMLRTHSILRTDPFTFTAHGHAWVDQQWGAAVLLAILHSLGGWTAVLAARAVLVAITFRLVYLLCLRRSGDRVLSARLTLVGFAAAALFPGALAARAQLFALPLFVVATWIVVDRDRHPRRLWLLPLVTAVWANLHGSFFLPGALLACATAGDAVRVRRVRVVRVAAVVACAAAAAVGPFGLRVYGYVASLRSNPVVVGSIDEWRPLSPVSLAGGVFVASLVALAVLLVRRRVRPSAADVVTFLTLTAMAVASGRAIVWWALFAPVAIAGGVVRREEAVAKPAGTIDPGAVVLVALVAALVAVAGVRVATIGRAGITDAPVGITSFLASHVEPERRVFDGWYGSWFEYALPGRPTFVDARAEIFPANVWADYFDVSAARPGWESILDRWDISVVVASPDHQGPLIAAMRDAPGWREAYRDGDGAVFVRSGCACVMGPATAGSG